MVASRMTGDELAWHAEMVAASREHSHRAHSATTVPGPTVSVPRQSTWPGSYWGEELRALVRGLRRLWADARANIRADERGSIGLVDDRDQANAMAADRRRYRDREAGMTKAETAQWYERQAVQALRTATGITW